MLRPLGVTNQTGRISIKERPLTSDQAFLEHVQAMRDGMRTAVDQVITCQPTHVIMGVALEAFWGGVAAADELQRELADRAGVGVSMGSTATVAALQRFGAKSIAVLTPHQPRGDEQVRRYFEEAGFSIKRLIGLKCPSPVQIAHTTRQQVVDFLHTLDGDDVDALVQVGTNLAAIGVCAEAERSFGKPVLAINAITYWDALRRCGIEDRIQGYGRTLEEF
jgi:maleate isomerase